MPETPIFYANMKAFAGMAGGKMFFKENNRAKKDPGIDIVPSAFLRLPEQIETLRQKVVTATGIDPTEYHPGTCRDLIEAEEKISRNQQSIIVKNYHIIVDLPLSVTIGNTAKQDWLLMWSWQTFFVDMPEIINKIKEQVDGVKPIDKYQETQYHAFVRQGRI